MQSITIDLEDWFHRLDTRLGKNPKQWKSQNSRLVQNTYSILDYLAEKNLKAQFFCLGWIAMQYPQLIKEIHRRGFPIGSHSFWHKPIPQQHPDEFASDLNLSLDCIQQLIGEKITAYRSPGFSLDENTPWAYEILAEYGIKESSSTKCSYQGEPYTMATIKGMITEYPLPLNRFRLPYSGGGYFRLWPMGWIKYWLGQHPYQLFYFHPRDFDARTPSPSSWNCYTNWKAQFHTAELYNRLDNLSEYFFAYSQQ